MGPIASEAALCVPDSLNPFIASRQPIGARTPQNRANDLFRHADLLQARQRVVGEVERVQPYLEAFEVGMSGEEA